MPDRQHFWVREDVELAVVDLIFSGLQLPPKVEQAGADGRTPCKTFTEALKGCFIVNSDNRVKRGVPFGEVPAGAGRLLINPNVRARNERLQKLSGDTGIVPDAKASSQRTFDSWLATLIDSERAKARDTFAKARAIALKGLRRHGSLLSTDPGGPPALASAARPAPSVGVSLLTALPASK